LTFAFVAIFFVNLNADTQVLGISMRLLTVAPVALALYHEYFRLQSAAVDYRLEKRLHLATNAAWGGTVTIAALLRFELSPDWVAAGWALLSFLLIAVAWELSPRDRYLTFITLGSALLLVSFLYSRYREAIWRYL
jgi:hypothetical protein